MSARTPIEQELSKKSNDVLRSIAESTPSERSDYSPIEIAAAIRLTQDPNFGCHVPTKKIYEKRKVMSREYFQQTR